MPETSVRRLLDLSTGHLPAAVCLTLSGFDGVVAYRTDYGWLLWVPGHGEDVDLVNDHNADYDEIPAEVTAVQRYARALGCDYVLFDQDGPLNDDLKHWDW